jgi:hypothetical protein
MESVVNEWKQIIAEEQEIIFGVTGLLIFLVLALWLIWKGVSPEIQRKRAPLVMLVLTPLVLMIFLGMLGPAGLVVGICTMGCLWWLRAENKPPNQQ